MKRLAYAPPRHGAEAGKLEKVQILRVEGDKILTQSFANKMRVFNKSDAAPAPLNPKVKAGDKVKATFLAFFEDAIVVVVDEKPGKVTVKFDTQPNERTLNFGDVTR